MYIYNNICSLQIGINNKEWNKCECISLLVAGVTGCLKGVSGEEDIYATMNLILQGKYPVGFQKKVNKTVMEKCIWCIKKWKK